MKYVNLHKEKKLGRKDHRLIIGKLKIKMMIQLN